MLPALPDPRSRLNAAYDHHDADRRRALAGVTGGDLDADKHIWSAIGEALADVAQMIADGCRASGLCGGQPATTAICARLVEAIDDQIDLPAWTIIEAAAGAAVAAKCRMTSALTYWCSGGEICASRRPVSAGDAQALLAVHLDEARAAVAAGAADAAIRALALAGELHAAAIRAADWRAAMTRRA